MNFMDDNHWTQNYNSILCFVLVWNFVSYINRVKVVMFQKFAQEITEHETKSKVKEAVKHGA